MKDILDLKGQYKLRDKEGKEHKPKWVDASDGENYYPSSNIPPTSHTPVMYSTNPGMIFL